MKNTNNRVRKFNWIEIQKFYNTGKRISDLKKEFKIGDRILKSAKKQGLLLVRSKRASQLLRTDKSFKKYRGFDFLSDHEKINKCIELYNEGYSTRDLYKSGISVSLYDYCIKNKFIIPRTLKEAAKIKFLRKGAHSVSEENKRNTSIRQSLNNSGGKCKWFEVAGQKVQGTWERDFVEKLEIFNISWYKPKVNRDVWNYIINFQQKSYTPDLFLPDFNLFIEIKGYWWGNDKEKMKLVLEQHSDKKLLLVEKELFFTLLKMQKDQLIEYFKFAR